MKSLGDPTDPPVRLRLQATRGSVLEQALSQASERGPTDEQLGALARNVLTTLGAAGAASLVTAAARSGARRPAGLAIATSKVIIGLTLAAVAGGGVWAWRRPAAIVPAHAVAPVVPATSAPALVPAAVAPRPLSTTATATARPRRAPGTAPAASERARTPAPSAADGARAQQPTRGAAPVDDGEELRLLARAHRALELDPAFALTLAHEHQRRFPDGAMDQEREVIAVSALMKLGRADDARQRAERFARDHAGSAYLAQMRTVLAQGAPRP